MRRGLLFALFFLPAMVVADPADDIAEWIENNITYVEDEEDFWQTPEETLTRGAGDCEDMSILFLDMLYKRTGEKGIAWHQYYADGTEHMAAWVWNKFYFLIPGSAWSSWMDYDHAIYLAEFGYPTPRDTYGEEGELEKYTPPTEVGVYYPEDDIDSPYWTGEDE
jgi:hypothetical protein